MKYVALLMLIGVVLYSCSSETPFGEKDCQNLAQCLHISDVTYQNGQCKLTTPNGIFTIGREVLPASLVVCQLGANECKQELTKCKE